MGESNTTIMIVAILVGLVFSGLPCLEALSPMGAPVMSPGSPMVMSPSSPTVMPPTAMAPTTDCQTALTNVTDCFTFVMVGSNMTVPEKKCCPELAGLLDSNPLCLCTLIDQADNFGIDVNRSLTLPKVCKLTTPPVSLCPGSPMVMSPSSPPVMPPTAMAPTTDCQTALTNVTDCLTFVMVGSNLTVPEKKCCPELAGLLDSNPLCLCSLIDQADNFGIDVNRSLKLPKVCKLTTPPVSLCPGHQAPVPAPGSASEAPGSTAGPFGGAALSPAGSDNAGASVRAVHDLSTIICLAAAIFIAYHF